ncbi:hypothetical protein IscW_ISCW014798 [Ixodes scapularis]|uniref:Uncharacterized protein n=1 Tax=Ixodes scapularis TaxID=6945 RepID=B7QHX1_IXOSC|nr:hypothetical protein IscW_ISCW014798 [Ixodes scapularis]|eukprot:XP_002414778.1 hypothetical protein IscW_ISCW014798 [Ixodes scapularis]
MFAEKRKRLQRRSQQQLPSPVAEGASLTPSADDVQGDGGGPGHRGASTPALSLSPNSDANALQCRDEQVAQLQQQLEAQEQQITVLQDIRADLLGRLTTVPVSTEQSNVREEGLNPTFATSIPACLPRKFNGHA